MKKSAEEKSDVWAKALGDMLHVFPLHGMPESGTDYASQFIKLIRQVQNKWNIPGFLTMSDHEIKTWLVRIGLVSGSIKGPINISPDTKTRLYRLTIGTKPRHSEKIKSQSVIDKYIFFIAFAPEILKEQGEWDNPFFIDRSKD